MGLYTPLPGGNGGYILPAAMVINSRVRFVSATLFLTKSFELKGWIRDVEHSYYYSLYISNTILNMFTSIFAIFN